MNRYCVKWTRKDSIALGEVAMQVGLDPVDAQSALTIGARLLAHGFSDHEMTAMILWGYSKRVEIEESVTSGTATPSQFREYRRLRGLDVQDD